MLKKSIVIVCMLSIGCTKTPSDADVAGIIRSLLPEAASISAKDFESLAASDRPSADAIKSQSLSIVALDWSPPAKGGKSDFWIGDGDLPPSASELAAAMYRSKDKGYATILQPEFITEVTCKVDGDSAKGEVAFAAAKLFGGRLEYTARRVNGAWRIEEFHLPLSKMRLTRQADGNWRREK